MAIRVRVRIEGIREILRAFDELPPEAQEIVRDRSMELAQDLANAIQVAGQMDSRQSAVAARSVKAKRDRVPVITAGTSGGKKARGVLFGSEFGATRRFGWYARGRFYGAVNKQFRPHHGASSYWFFVTVERNEERTSRAYTEMASDIIRRWAG